MSLEQFLLELDSSVPQPTRKLAALISQSDDPIRKHFQADAKTISESLSTLLNRDTDYVNSDMLPEDVEAKEFYKGYSANWAAIIHKLDVRRKLADNLLGEIVLAEEGEKKEKSELIVIKGFAGSGKSVLLRRIAWDASVEFNKLCLYVKTSAFPSYEPLLELHRVTHERIFLFIDRLAEYADFVEGAIQKAKADDFPLTIIAAERPHEWNEECKNLHPLLTEEYEVKNLNEKEIVELIELLELHNSLGHLKILSREDRIDALRTRAGRQLLVALYEATSGKPFEEIVADEYNSLSSLRAKNLYLTVCVLHRIGVFVRAGLIARIHNISFIDFQKNLFLPLEQIVYAKYNPVIRDYEYGTRHPIIAEMVFDRVLVNPQDRFDEYLRLVNALDLGYKSDFEAFKEMVNARKLIRLFTDQRMIRQIYEGARKRAGETQMLLHQEAVFEMNSPGGSLIKATELLDRANKLAPYSRTILHSLAVLAAKKSVSAHTEIEKKKLRDESKMIAQSLISNDPYSAHAYHTLIKIQVDELKDLLAGEDDVSIERKVKEIERNLNIAKQGFPDEDYIFDIEATFSSMLEQDSRAYSALKKAFDRNRQSQYLAIRLSKMHEARDEKSLAINTLELCLDSNPTDNKSLHFRLALLLSENGLGDDLKIGYHLRRSFTDGDNNHLAQFYYARYLYLIKDHEESQKVFLALSRMRVSGFAKRKPRGVVYQDGEQKSFIGTVIKVEAHYCFIRADGFSDNIFSHNNFSTAEQWKRLETTARVTFHLAFNYLGPVAINVLRDAR